MKPVHQTTFRPSEGDGAGNCLQACLASVLELALDEVPNFAAIEGPSWFTKMEKWLSRRGLGFVILPLDAPAIAYAWALPTDFETYVLLSGKSPRGDFQHIVVAEILGHADGYSFQPRHDPHPEGGYFDGEAKKVWLFITDPARARKDGSAP